MKLERERGANVCTERYLGTILRFNLRTRDENSELNAIIWERESV